MSLFEASNAGLGMSEADNVTNDFLRALSQPLLIQTPLQACVIIAAFIPSFPDSRLTGLSSLYGHASTAAQILCCFLTDDAGDAVSAKPGARSCFAGSAAISTQFACEQYTDIAVCSG